MLPSHPILDCTAAGEYERQLLGGDEEREWEAMQRAGRALAEGIRRELNAAATPLQGRVLVLAGKGHNGGDALLAAAHLAHAVPELVVDLALVFGDRALRPLAMRAWRELEHAASGRVWTLQPAQFAANYTAIIDGVFGFQFRPPIEAPALGWLAAANSVPAQLRVAVDLPSGLGEEGAFRADVTFATGIVKTPLVDLPNAGRLRYLDIGFFRGDEEAEARVLTRDVLAPLRRMRPAESDKRNYGHLLVVGGSRRYPGAILMTVQAAIRAGVGLITACVPESLAPAFAAAWPEAMWNGCPETADGGLSLAGDDRISALMDRANALLIGPGLGREIETLTLGKDLLRLTKVPAVLDADALQPDLMWSGSGPRILTPHAGEYQRISSGADLADFRGTRGSVTVLKGHVTRISDGSGVVYHSLGGGPVLARGGSGDMLAGIIGALLAQEVANLPEPGPALDPVYDAVLRAAGAGVFWHARAAELWAEARGEVAVRATELLDYLGPALRS